jgi:hypothetical protein
MGALSRDELLALAAAGRIEALRDALAGASPAVATDVAAGLAERADAASLAALDAGELPKPVRKAMRRALHGLKAKGVHVPESGRVARLAGPPAEQIAGLQAEAWISLPRPSVSLVLVVRTPAERRLFVGLLDEEERIVEGASFGNASKQGVRDFLQRQSAEGHPFVPLAPEHVAARLRAAAIRPPSPHAADAGVARAELAERLAFFASLEEAEHPALDLAPADDAQSEHEAEGVAARFSPQDLPFALDQKLMHGLVERLNQARTSPLVLSPALTADREGRIVLEFVERDLPAALCRGLALRLLDRAWVTRNQGEPQGARAEAAAGAVLLRRPDSPVARRLLQAFVMAHMRRPSAEEPQGSGGSPAPGRLIVTL